MGQQLERLLESCTVKLSIPGKIGWGTGFFVAPGLILTCHHVVKDAENGKVQVCWQNQENFAEAVIERSLFELDLALLKFNPSVVNLPCVYLDESFQADDSLYTYGYPDDFPQGASVTAECEGIATDKQPLIKFKAGQIRPGLSGSPLLNQRTRKVCGIVKFTRDRSFDLGGGAVPTSEILSQFPELEELQQAFHQRDDRWTKLLPPPPSQTRLSRQEYRNRQVLLNKVNQFWVKGILERSLHNQVLIELGLEERPDAVAQPWNIDLQTADEKSKPLPEGTKVIDLFDEIGEGRTLLILGEPGAGKTTTLLELTRNLIARAEQNIDHLIPVVFNLSSWAVKNQKIEDWLVEELNSKYQVPKKIGKTLVREDQLILLLDGLDEVKAEYREQCITALNQFHQEYCPEIVVCSRIKDYKALSNRLNFQSAVYLRLLTLEQIRHYLNSLGSKVTGLRTLVEEDQALQDLAKSPLMLSIMTLAYKGVAVEDLPKTDVVEERRKQLFDDYIERMSSYERIVGYQARSKNKQRYSKTETIHWLIWLAQTMFQESQTVFLIEKIQPYWLRDLRFNNVPIKFWLLLLEIDCLAGILFLRNSLKRKQKQTYKLIGVLITGLVSGLILQLLSVMIVLATLCCTAMYPSGIGLIQLLMSETLIAGPVGLLIGMIVGPFIGLTEEIKTVEIIQFNWKKMLMHVFSAWRIIGLFIGSILTFVLIRELIAHLSLNKELTELITGLILYLIILLGWVLIYLAVVALFGGVLAGLQSSEIETKTRPNQGIWTSFHNAITVWLIFGLIGCPIGGLLGVLSGNSISIMIAGGLIMGLFVGVLYAMMKGGKACVQHFSLRLTLYCNNYIPWNYARFLDYAEERIFLQKVGGGYIFIHRMLMEHFAKMELEK